MVYISLTAPSPFSNFFITYKFYEKFASIIIILNTRSSLNIHGVHIIICLTILL
jgi:hypothetical protein